MFSDVRLFLLWLKLSFTFWNSVLSRFTSDKMPCFEDLEKVADFVSLLSWSRESLKKRKKLREMRLVWCEIGIRCCGILVEFVSTETLRKDFITFWWSTQWTTSKYTVITNRIKISRPEKSAKLYVINSFLFAVHEFLFVTFDWTTRPNVLRVHLHPTGFSVPLFYSQETNLFAWNVQTIISWVLSLVWVDTLWNIWNTSNVYDVCK